MTLKTKLDKLITEIGYDDVPLEPFLRGKHHDYVLWPHNGTHYLIMETIDYDLLMQLRDDMDKGEAGQQVVLAVITPQRLFAILLTGGQYVTLTDHNGWATLPAFTTRGFLGFGKERPNYAKIAATMERCGLTFTKPNE